VIAGGAARRWRLLGGAARRVGGELRFGVADEPLRVAWTPAGDLASASVLRVFLRGPLETTVEVTGAPSAAHTVSVVEHDGRRWADLPLAPGWADRLAGGDLVLALASVDSPSRPGARETVPSEPMRFEGVAFLRGEAGGDAGAPPVAR
jgi:hypothetical protein